MGIIRVLLASSVVVCHSGSVFLSGSIAVQIFFIVSGFYMSLIWDTKYKNKQNSYYLFISNRVLRIFPTYLLIIFITILVFFVHWLISHNAKNTLTFYHQHIDFATLFFLVLTNITIIGQDLTWFFTVNSHQAWKFMFCVPAWSLSLELMFYLIAPFLLKEWLFYSLFTLCLPFIFKFTKNIKFDRLLGELSYPMYVSHWLIISLIAPIFNFLKLTNFSLIVMISTLMISSLLVIYLIIPIDKYRSSR